MSMPNVPGLYVLAGLVPDAPAPEAVAVPEPEVAQAQLRALQHRTIDVRVDPTGDLLRALTHDDFMLTAADGRWHDRARFLADAPTQAVPPNTGAEDVRVRLFGTLALVHGLYARARPEAPPARVRYTDVHRWSGGTWQLVSVQETALAADVAAELVRGNAPPHAGWNGRDPAGDDDTVLHALNEAYVAAFRGADVAWYDAHLATDYLVINGDGSLHDKAGALARFARPTFATTMRSFPVERVRVRRFDDLALIHAENAYELKDGRSGVSRYTDIWHRRDGRWLCVAAHITAQRAP